MNSRPTRSRLAAAAALRAGLATMGLATLGFATLGLSPLPAHADAVRAAQWQLSALDAPAAWSRSTGAGVVVAVLDSGVDADHPDLAGHVLSGADFVDGTTDGRTDPVGHGTAVAGLIAGRADDSAGVEGIAPDAEILPVRVLDAQNKYADAATVAEGLRWAVDHGAGVVNVSLGGAIRSDTLAAAIGYAYAHDVVVVACTGNKAADEPTDVWYPAREPGVVAVAGLAPIDPATPDPATPDPATPDPARPDSATPDSAADSPAAGSAAPGSGVTLWSGGLTGPYTVLTAPAVDLLAAKPGGYWQVQGTSFAAPLVAGVAALIRARWPGMDAANVVNRLISTADDLGPAGRDPLYGYGEVDPVRALTATGIRSVTRNPLLAAAATEPAAASAPAAAGAGGPAADGPGRPDPAPATTVAGAAGGGHDRIWWVLAGCVVVAAGTLGAGLVLVRRRPTGR
jgi:subtilisin family serine protease